MELTPQSITEAVLKDDVETIVGVLEQFGFRKNEEPSSFSSESKRLATTILNVASARAYASYHWADSNSVEYNLISYIAPVVNILDFLELVKIALEFSSGFDSEERDRLISEKLRTALRENKPSKEALALIEELDDYAAELLALYITDSKEVTALCWEFVVPLLRLMYEIVPDDIFFSYMASNLMPCTEEAKP